MSEANKWLFVDQDLPNVGETVLVKFCVVDRITGDTTMVDAEGQFTGFWKGSANFEVTMETNPLSLNSRTKIIAWKRSDSIEEKPDEETDDEKPESFEDTTESTETEQPAPTKRKLVGAREVCQWLKDTSLGAELRKALRQIQFECGCTVLSVTETTTKTHDIEKQGFIIVYEYEEK